MKSYINGVEPNETLTAWIELVPDYEAIKECKLAADAVILQYTNEIADYKSEIERIENLISEIENKTRVSDELIGEYISAQASLSSANIKTDIKTDCVSCLNRINTELSSISTSCTTELETLNTKLKTARQNLSSAKIEKINCNNKTKKVYHSGFGEK